VVSKEQPIKIT